MTASEIAQEISQLERSIAETEKRRAAGGPVRLILWSHGTAFGGNGEVPDQCDHGFPGNRQTKMNPS